MHISRPMTPRLTERGTASRDPAERGLLEGPA